MLTDARLAFRTLLETPAFTLTTAAVLALGIGANTAIFGLSAFDLPTFALMTLVLLGAALVASYVPALRATRVDPLTALRTE